MTAAESRGPRGRDPDGRPTRGAELAALRKPPTAYAAVPRQPGPTAILKRGDVEKPGDPVTPGSPAVVTGPPAADLPADAPEGERRRAFADWVVHRDNPLSWRVIVNRVWQHHFGDGLVRTPNDFGLNGDRPTHPELLDWLAAWFRDSGGRLKPLHRLIVTSATYRQANTLRREGGRRGRRRPAPVAVRPAAAGGGGRPGRHARGGWTAQPRGRRPELPAVPRRDVQLVLLHPDRRRPAGPEPPVRLPDERDLGPRPVARGARLPGPECQNPPADGDHDAACRR